MPNLRPLPSLDYAKFAETGEKIVKDRGESEKMDLDTLKNEELKILEDIKHFKKVYAAEDLDTADDFKEALDGISGASQRLRHIHVDLKQALGETEYAAQYPKYDEHCQNIATFIKALRDGRKSKSTPKAEVVQVASGSNVSDRKAELSIEEDVLSQKIEKLNSSIDVGKCTDVYKVRKYLDRMEEYASQYFDLGGKFKRFYDEEECEKHSGRINSVISLCYDDVRVAEQRILKLDEDSKSKEASEENSRLEVKAKSLCKEITIRCDALDAKLDREVKILSDYQLLELSQDKTLDIEFNDVIAKVTDLSNFVMGGSKVVQELLDTATGRIDRVAALKKTFLKNVQVALDDRDITPDKLKNAATLQIELPKFSGYDCKIDFFTFKSEFKKLVEPTVLKKRWSDYLKRNYLSGSAFKLVEKETDYEKIWNRLEESYGNARLMLQNKLAGLDKLGGFWKLKGEENLADALATLVNAMKDLSSLATEHDIEGALYEGGGLEKILLLIGNQRHRDFRKKNLKILDKKVEWGKLQEFLVAELELRERIILDNKTAKILGLDPKNDPPKNSQGSKGGGSGAHFGDKHEPLKCHICGAGNHTAIVTRKGRKILPYYVCEKFVKATAAQRMALLTAKSFCTQCMFPGAVKGPNHKCLFLNFCCPHPSHEEGAKHHVLLCDAHKMEASNLDLLIKFKEKFIQNCKFPLPECSKNIACFSGTVLVNRPLPSADSKFGDLDCQPDVVEHAIFQFQTIKVGDVTLRLFFDTGCGDMVIRKSAADKLATIGRAIQVLKGPLNLTGVGDHQSVCQDGLYSICLPLHDGSNVRLTGLCLPKVTGKFPVYDLKAVGKDLRNRCLASGGQGLVDQLPKLPNKVGGDVDILLGSKYNRLLPKVVFESEDGFGISRSSFASPCGSRGVLSGPHPEFTRIENAFRGVHSSHMAYFYQSVEMIRELSMRTLLPAMVGGIKDVHKMASIDEPICCSIHDVIEPMSECCDDPTGSCVLTKGMESGAPVIEPSGPTLNDDIETVAPTREMEPDSSLPIDAGTESDTPESGAPLSQDLPGLPTVVDCPIGGFEISPFTPLYDVNGPHCGNLVLDSQVGPVSNDASLFSSVFSSEMYAARRAPKCIKQYDEIERAGTEVTYRCVDCRGCIKCKTGERFDAISIQEELEQALIEKSVKVNPDDCTTTAKLPFVVDPDTRLNPEAVLITATKVYKSQVRNLNKSPEDKTSVIESEKKLQDLGFVDFLDNLCEEDQNNILQSAVRYFIPWRAVWNEKSVTTPCRLVFDGSMGSKDSPSLNSLLPKGMNGMNKLVEVVTRWTTKRHAFHTDVSKMYNTIKLDKSHWRYQMYLWSPNLDVGEEPRWKVIKTAIYGIRSSGNQAECGLRRTAELSRNDYPEACDAIVNDTYVDDLVGGTQSKRKTLQLTEEIPLALAPGGFLMKGYTRSGEDPPDHLSEDKESIMVGGMKWFPKGDFLKLNIKELNFGKRIRGKKSAKCKGLIPDVLTMRDCASVASEIFDILGKVTPITAGLKLDVSILHQYRLGWDDPIPNELKNIWAANFDLISELGDLKFERAVVPEDAVNLDVQTIDTADAGDNLVCAAIYARFKLKSGRYSCQLIFSRSKVIHDLTTPRAELVAALLNASTGHVVRQSLKGMLKKSWKFSDSQVALHWINCTKTGLKMWVRNRVCEIARLTDLICWYHIDRKYMIADLGTRKGATILDVSPGSLWLTGFPWYSDSEENFPCKSIEEIKLSHIEKADANKEKILDEYAADSSHCFETKYVPQETGERYKFSRYLVNPTKYRFSIVTRILALVFMFIQKINVRNTKFSFMTRPANVLLQEYMQKGAFFAFPVNSSHTQARTAVLFLTDDLINAARTYYFRKATAEIKGFVDPVKYKNKSVLKDGILYYTGRILASQEIDGTPSLSGACLDLSASTFCVPMTDSLSPIAYAIVMETHWYNPDVSHGGVESVLRFSQNTAYILGGRELVKSIKKSCTKCRILHKKGVKAAMGQIGENNLCVAPPFYMCQVDICGPFSAYSPANKRATVKVWFVVFCCTTTSAVDCRVMENYSADAFLLSFVRFSSRFGYPKTLMPDEGSQLIKGCQDMIISFSDVKNQLFVEHGVDYKPCPVGAHYIHGKVERKIQTIKHSFVKLMDKERLSIIQWETLGQQVANSINNMPIGLQNKCDMLEHLDVLTPNRLILGRNNNRNPTVPLKVTYDLRGIIETNDNIVKAWFKVWLTSHVPTLIEQPKWFVSDRDIRVGDVVLFLKSDKEFDRQYQYGLVVTVVLGRDGITRVVEIQYQNANEKQKRTTKRGVRDIIVIHPVDEVGILNELCKLSNSC
jgi:hypothetical protein